MKRPEAEIQEDLQYWWEQHQEWFDAEHCRERTKELKLCTERLRYFANELMEARQS